MYYYTNFSKILTTYVIKVDGRFMVPEISKLIVEPPSKDVDWWSHPLAFLQVIVQRKMGETHVTIRLSLYSKILK